MADEDGSPTSAAEAQMSMLEHVIEEGMGVSFRGGNRDDGKSNEEIILYLAGLDENGNPNPNVQNPRDIRANQEDEKEMANLYLERVDKQLQTIGTKTSNGQEIDEEKAATSGAVSGLRAAGKYLAKKMQERVESRTTNDGQSAQQVTGRYAAQRARDWGVSEDVVYVRSGQLATALIEGKLKIEKTDASIKALLENR
jgi:hypothetical protein